MPRAWFTGALHRAGPLLPFSPGSCWAPGGLSHSHARRREQQQQALSVSPEPTRGSFSGDGCAAKSEKRRMGAARVRVCVSPWVRLSVSAPGQPWGTPRGLPASHRLRGRSSLSQPGRGWGAGAPGCEGPAGHWGSVCPRRWPLYLLGPAPTDSS